jgi:hypothetical protein
MGHVHGHQFRCIYALYVVLIDAHGHHFLSIYSLAVAELVHSALIDKEEDINVLKSKDKK